MAVEFETQDSLAEFTSMTSNRRSLPRVESSQAKMALGISVALMIVATLFIWLKVGSPARPYIDDSAGIRHSSQGVNPSEL